VRSRSGSCRAALNTANSRSGGCVISNRHYFPPFNAKNQIKKRKRPQATRRPDRNQTALFQIRGGTGFQPVKSGISPDFARTLTAQVSDYPRAEWPGVFHP